MTSNLDEAHCCPHCGGKTTEEHAVIAFSVHDNKDTAFLHRGPLDCDHCGFALWPTAKEMDAYLLRARQALSFCAHALRKYHNDQTVSEAVRIPFAIYVALVWAVDATDMGYCRQHGLGVIDDAGILYDKETKLIPPTASVRVPAQFVVDGVHRWKCCQQRKKLEWNVNHPRVAAAP